MSAMGPEIASVRGAWVFRRSGFDLRAENVFADGQVGSGRTAMEDFGSFFFWVRHEVDGEAVVVGFGCFFWFFFFAHAAVAVH